MGPSQKFEVIPWKGSSESKERVSLKKCVEHTLL